MPSAQLIVSQPGQEKRRLDVSAALVSIGRRSDNTLALAGDSNVSKYHAVIEARGDGFWLTDLGSSNGTTVNDAAVKAERQLADGDLIRLGGTSTIEFRLPAAQAQGAGDGDGAGSGVAAPGAGLSGQSDSTSADSAFPVAASPSPAAEKPASKLPLVMAAVVLGGLVVTGVLAAVLYATGVVGAKSRANAATPTPIVSQNDEGVAGEAEEEEATPTPFEEMTFDATPPLVPTPTPNVSGVGSVGADATSVFAGTLAAQISQKNIYQFDPSFVALINSHTGEYRAAAGYHARAAKYREVIDREFVNAQGIQPPLIGYVMAMSLTKFVEGENGGVWALPGAVLSEAGAASVAADPAASTRAAATYMKELLNLFGKDEFIYAVACYGMTLQEAGKFHDELEKNDPGGQHRFDFWKMKTAGVVGDEQSARVARFFAAGVVGENPKAFGLTTDGQLSSLSN